MVDLRSDTVTRPTSAMRRSMLDAEVGDDVFLEDPTVQCLEARAAELLGFGAALFVPSGTMGNQIALQLHTRRGSDVVLDATSHIYLYELGAMAAWSGALPRVIQDPQGLTPENFRAALAPDIYYLARADLLCLENSRNHAGGRVVPLELHDELCSSARRAGLAIHLDGARIFNAAAALGCEAKRLATGCDTVMFCLSKGLGAPVGSLLCADPERIRDARVLRKRMGGGMRQVGILAAAGLHALDHHVSRLHEDHERARRLGRAIAGLEPFSIDPGTVETNIVIAELKRAERLEPLLEFLAERGVRAVGMGRGRIRFVTHLEVTDEGVGEAISALERAVEAEVV